MSRPFMSSLLRLGTVGLLALPVSAHAQSAAFAALVDARKSLEAGSYREAEAKYAGVLRGPWQLDNQLRAAALFGRAFAAQQRLVNGDTIGAPIIADSLLNAYREAAELNPKALGDAATDNIAVVLASVGRRTEAATAYLDLGRQKNGSRYYVNAGREFDAANDTSAALAAYRQSLSISPRDAEARRALLELLARSRPPRELLDAVAQFPDTAAARDVSNALLAMLTRREPLATTAEATEATVQLARVWTRMRMGTAYFDAALRDGMALAAQRDDNVARGIQSMIEAYSLPKNSVFIESENARWWHADDGAPNGRAAAWSSLLRSLGDWHNQQGALEIARSYYEAAIGLRARLLNMPSIDRSALLPLALIYAQGKDAKSTSDLYTGLREFTEIIFSAKNAAYRAADLVQIREFHTTLGALYSVRGEWSGTDAQNARFQLEHMREASRALAQRTNKPVIDPPELLESLAIYYKLNGRPDSAARVRAQVVSHYERLNLPNEATAAKTRIDTTTKLRSTMRSTVTPNVVRPAPTPNALRSTTRPPTTQPPAQKPATATTSIRGETNPRTIVKPDSAARRDSVTRKP
jgi:tetratricopeptide repeat protein